MRELVLLSIAVLIVSCGDAETDDDMPLPEACTKDSLESDLEPAAFQGPGVVPATGAIRPPSSGGAYVVAATYLTLKADAEAQQNFQTLLGPVIARLNQSPGLVAVSTGSSMSCGTARTLTVWEDEAAMMGFVLSTEHAAAMAGISQISRGGSVTLRWNEADPTKVSWSAAIQRLAAHTGVER